MSSSDLPEKMLSYIGCICFTFLQSAFFKVGKLAQPVPVMVARSLELFAKSLLLAAAKVAEQSGAKTLTPVHLKTAVEEDERLDFLKDKVRISGDI